MITPREIRRLGPTGVEIRWNDGTLQQISSEVLRQSCPCAVCLEARGSSVHEKPLTPTPPKKKLLAIVEASKDQALRLDRIWAIGNYAVGAHWGDGHETGVYSYDLLRSLDGKN